MDGHLLLDDTRADLHDKKADVVAVVAAELRGEDCLEGLQVASAPPDVCARALWAAGKADGVSQSKRERTRARNSTEPWER